MARLFRFLLINSLAFGGVVLLMVSAIKLAQTTGVIPNGHDWGLVLKGIMGPEPLPVGKLKVRRSIMPRAVVVLDAGHGGVDGGTLAGRSLEKDLNLKVVHMVAEELRRKMIRVVFTRQGDATEGLKARADFANGFPAALFVSIHHNASTSGKPEGFETYYTYPKHSSVMSAQRKIFGVQNGEKFIDRRGELLAREIQSASCSATQAVDRGIKNSHLALTRLVSCPAVLVECGFLSNAREGARLKDVKYRGKLSAGISRGIMAFLAEVAGKPSYGIELSTPTSVSIDEVPILGKTVKGSL
jgi:N-acetylmuramoyl-L-alanine amidase